MKKEFVPITGREKRKMGRPVSGPVLIHNLTALASTEMKQQAERRAEAEGVSVGEIIRRALAEYLKDA